MRKIIHIDMDAFYASVEQRDNPNLRGKPIVVARDEERGVICAASYEARKYGIKSAMPASTARELCSELIFVAPRIEYYRTVSASIHSIFTRVTSIIEPLSLDEAYLDVTENKLNQPSAQQLAQYIRSAIKKELGLTASAGVSYNKFLAKTASDINKPDGIFVIPPSQGVAFIHSLPIEKFYGVGKVTAQKFKSFGIHNGADLAAKDKAWLVQNFGKNGVFYYGISRGLDNRPVVANRKAHSIASEQTFASDIENIRHIIGHLEQIFNDAYTRLLVSLEIPRTVVLKIKYADFSVITRSKTLPEATTDTEVLRSALIALCDPDELFAKKIRLLGVSFSNFKDTESDNPAQAIITFE